MKKPATTARKKAAGIRRRCADCAFISKFEISGGGQCRLNPPIYKRGEEDVFPIVNLESWCGQFKAG